MRKATVLGVLALAGTCASPAFADEFSGVRLGIGLSQEAFKSDVSYLSYFDDVDADRFGYSLMGGWALNKWLAFEGTLHGGTDFNQTLRSGNLYPTRNVEMHTDLRAFEASVVGSWWITPKISLYGRGGLYAWKGETTFTEDVNINTDPPFRTSETFEDDGFAPMVGFGLQSTLDGAIVRVEYQYMEFDDYEQGSPELLDNKVSSLMFSIVWIL